MQPTPIINPTTFPAVRFANINAIVSVLLPVAYIIGAFVFGGMLVKTAFMVITAGGDKEVIQKAQQTATYAVLGILMILIAALLVNLVGFIGGIDVPFL